MFLPFFWLSAVWKPLVLFIYLLLNIFVNGAQKFFCIFRCFFFFFLHLCFVTLGVFLLLCAIDLNCQKFLLWFIDLDIWLHTYYYREIRKHLQASCDRNHDDCYSHCLQLRTNFVIMPHLVTFHSIIYHKYEELGHCFVTLS